MRFSVAIAIAGLAGSGLIAACSPVRITSDGGPDQDADVTDAAPVDPCEAPPTAVCGQPVDETCPLTVPDELAAVFPDRDPLGLLLPTTVLASADGLGPAIAIATVPALGGDHGTTALLALESDGAATRAVRIDVPQNDLRAASRGPLTGLDEAASGEAVTSIATRPLAHVSNARVVLHIGTSANERWIGFSDYVSQETSLNIVTGPHLDQVGVFNQGVVTRYLDVGAPILESVTVAQGALGVADARQDVPPDEDLRMVTTTFETVMLQDGAGRFWFWRALNNQPVHFLNLNNQSGRAALVHAGGSNHVLAWHRSGTVTFDQLECPGSDAAGGESSCSLTPIVSPAATISTVAPSGEVPDGVGLADGRTAVLVTERHDDGDRLVLQILEANRTAITLPRIELLDLRDAGERIVDARIDRIETASASTLVVAAAVGADTASARRVVMTGLRSCP